MPVETEPEKDAEPKLAGDPLEAAEIRLCPDCYRRQLNTPLFLDEDTKVTFCRFCGFAHPNEHLLIGETVLFTTRRSFVTEVAPAIVLSQNKDKTLNLVVLAPSGPRTVMTAARSEFPASHEKSAGKWRWRQDIVKRPVI